MGLAMLHYIASGFDVHLVSMTSGDAVGSAYFLNGANPSGTPVVCPTSADHPWTHSPEREGYEPLTTEGIGAARILEARAALGVMAMVPPIKDSNGNTITPGPVFHHVGGLHDGFGAPGQASSTAPVTREGIDAAKEIIFPFVRDYPNSFHITMSPADHHHDHAACGIALKEIKQENPAMLGTPLFFVSRLYWAISQPDGKYQQDLLDEAHGTLAWFSYYGSNYSSYVDHLRNRVIKAYRAWNPAAGAYGIGYHQVRSQFESNFGANASVANLFHT